MSRAFNVLQMKKMTWNTVYDPTIPTSLRFVSNNGHYWVKKHEVCYFFRRKCVNKLGSSLKSNDATYIFAKMQSQ